MSVRREQHGGVLIVTIDRPEARNAVNGEVAAGLEAAFDAAEKDASIFAVVLTGAGDKAFCAGMDLREFAVSGAKRVFREKTGFASITQREFPKPLIAAVNGHALAGGMEILLSCDIVVSVPEATFGLPEVKRGLLANAGGPIRLAQRLPLAVALELSMTGAAIDAPRALALGLVNRVVPREQLLSEALAIAGQIAANAPLAVRAVRELVRRAAQLDEASAWDVSRALAQNVNRSEDAREGAVAFAEKRNPVWKGR
jgi:enoyl-CoA hydratase/carnithine racemase